MRNLVKNELKKAVCSKTFVLGCGLLLIFAILSGLYCIDNYRLGNDYSSYIKNGNFTENPTLSLYSFFYAWLGGDTNSLAYLLFFYLMPVGSALPYAWSYYREHRCGYLKNIVIRTKKTNYLYSKMIAVFVSGALAVLIPYIVNILMVSAFVPYYKPWAGYNFYNLVYFGDLWADLFFTNPILHTFLVVALNVLYGGIYALLSFSISFYIKNIIAVLFGPMVFMIAAEYIEGILNNTYFNKKNAYFVYELVPVKFLHSREVGGSVTAQNVMLITIVLLAFSVVTVIVKGRKNEIL